MQTATQKILAAHAGKAAVRPGELIEAKLDLVLGNDVTAPIAIQVFEQAGFKRVFDPDKIAIVLDHYTPCKDIKSAGLCATARAFARRFSLTHFYDVGRVGIEHALLPEQGLVGAGDCIVGADSHTCTYGALGAFSTGVGSTDMAAAMATGRLWFKVPAAIQLVVTGRPRRWVGGKDLILHLIGRIGVEGALYHSLEFTGDGLAHLSIDDRFTIANMAVEAGAKNAFIPVDDITREYLQGRFPRPVRAVEADPGAQYARTIIIDLATLEPTVALPFLPSNTTTARNAQDLRIDQAVIGSCTNGRISDLRIAAEILRGRHIAPGVRCIVIPATPGIYRQALDEGLLSIFLDAGCAISTPTCGPCLGGHMGILAAGERAVATTNRNFVGRMGHPQSEVVLASPAVAAASALAGHIAAPEE